MAGRGRCAALRCGGAAMQRATVASDGDGGERARAWERSATHARYATARLGSWLKCSDSIKRSSRFQLIWDGSLGHGRDGGRRHASGKCSKGSHEERWGARQGSAGGDELLRLTWSIAVTISTSMRTPRFFPASHLCPLCTRHAVSATATALLACSSPSSHRHMFSHALPRHVVHQDRVRLVLMYWRTLPVSDTQSCIEPRWTRRHRPHNSKHSALPCPWPRQSASPIA